MIGGSFMVNIKLLEHLHLIKEKILEKNQIESDIQAIEDEFQNAIEGARVLSFRGSELKKMLHKEKMEQVKKEFEQVKSRVTAEIQLLKDEQNHFLDQKGSLWIKNIIDGLSSIRYGQVTIFPQNMIQWLIYVPLFLLLGYFLGFFSFLLKSLVYGIFFIIIPMIHILDTPIYWKYRYKISFKYRKKINHLSELESELKSTLLDEQELLESLEKQCEHDIKVLEKEEELSFNERKQPIVQRYQTVLNEKKRALETLELWLTDPQKSEVINPRFHKVEIIDQWIEAVENQLAHSVKELMKLFDFKPSETFFTPVKKEIPKSLKPSLEQLKKLEEEERLLKEEKLFLLNEKQEALSDKDKRSQILKIEREITRIKSEKYRYLKR